jgi:hypothetical protein
VNVHETVLEFTACGVTKPGMSGATRHRSSFPLDSLLPLISFRSRLLSSLILGTNTPVICAEMARVLIVGCGCRGRELGRALAAEGHAVRGTSRGQAGREAIDQAGLEGVVADPDRLATLLPALEGVSVVVWLLAGIADEALHGPRLASLLERLVDTPVRGFVYEGGPGEALVRWAAGTWRIPVEVASGEDVHAAVARLLAV